MQERKYAFDLRLRGKSGGVFFHGVLFLFELAGVVQDPADRSGGDSHFLADVLVLHALFPKGYDAIPSFFGTSEELVSWLGDEPTGGAF